MSDLRNAIQALLKRSPNPNKVQSVQAARDFKALVIQAGKARGDDKLRPILFQLKGYYE